MQSTSAASTHSSPAQLLPVERSMANASYARRMITDTGEQAEGSNKAVRRGGTMTGCCADCQLAALSESLAVAEAETEPVVSTVHSPQQRSMSAS